MRVQRQENRTTDVTREFTGVQCNPRHTTPYKTRAALLHRTPKAPARPKPTFWVLIIGAGRSLRQRRDALRRQHRETFFHRSSSPNSTQSLLVTLPPRCWRHVLCQHLSAVTCCFFSVPRNRAGLSGTVTVLGQTFIWRQINRTPRVPRESMGHSRAVTQNPSIRSENTSRDPPGNLSDAFHYQDEAKVMLFLKAPKNRLKK